MEMLETSIYPWRSKKIGIEPKSAMREISLVFAKQELLRENKVQEKVDNNEPLLKWFQKSYLSDGRIFECNETYYRITKFLIKEAVVL